MEFTRPRGTRDFLFDEMRERKKAESILRNVFENYAYQEIKTPLFEELKLFTTKSGEEIVDQFDHATVFNGTTPHIELANELMTRGHHVILVDYQPTSENMVVDFSRRIISRLPQGITLFSLKLQETESSFAEWFASDNMKSIL